MKLQSCNIRLMASYEKNAGKYEASITYEGKRGEEVKMVLDAEISNQLLGFIGPAITQFASRAAREIETNIAQSVMEANAPKAIDLPEASA